MLTPSLQQTPAFNASNFDFPIFDENGAATPPNLTVYGMRVSRSLCPSDTGRTVRPGFAPGNDMACAGDGQSNGGSALHGDPNGVSYYNSSTSLAQVTDGASQTVLVSESVLGPGEFEIPKPGSPDTKNVHAEVPFVVITEYKPLTVADCRAPTSDSGWRNRGWIQDDFRNMLYTHALAPNSTTYDCLRGSHYGRKAARSHHPGGVNVLFGDGSVKFIKESVDHRTWRALATRGGGEVVSADAY